MSGRGKNKFLFKVEVMKKERLIKLLLIERDKFITGKTFEELSKMEFPINYEVGNIKDKDFYQIEIDKLEKTNEYIDIIISIDDGSLWRSFCPITISFIVHKDGRVEK